MSKEINVASDFDGTVTNVQREAETYLAANHEILANKIGLGIYELKTMISRATEKIVGSPGMFGWEYHGLIVAPAEADPYLLNQAAVKLVLTDLRSDTRKLAIPTPEETDKFIDDLHHEAYPKAGIFFRDGAREYIEQLHASGKFTIVTNAKTEAVKRKLGILLGDKAGDLRLVGDARKYEVNQQWTQIPESTQPSGFPRKVYLRRQKYHDTLQQIGADIIVGDIYELDLALPEHLGIQTVLVLTNQTPKWEIPYYQNHPNGFSSNSLGEIAGKIR